MNHLRAKRFLLFFTLLFTLGFAWALPPGAAQGILDGLAASQQQQMNDQWIQMSRAWTNCVNQGGGAACGQAPSPPAQSYTPPPQTQYQPQYDNSCMSLCMNAKYEYASCQIQCRNR